MLFDSDDDFRSGDRNVNQSRPLDRTMSTTSEFQTSDISRALTPSCSLPVEKVAPGMRLVWK